MFNGIVVRVFSEQLDIDMNKVLHAQLVIEDKDTDYFIGMLREVCGDDRMLAADVVVYDMASNPELLNELGEIRWDDRTIT